jgi:lysozyme family protein
MALPNAEKLTSQMAMLPDAALKQMAMMHKNDPYVLPLIISEDGRRKQMRQAAQAQMAAPQSKVADAALAQMGQLPEEQGIGALPAPNMQSMADGGIAGYGDDEGMAQGGMFDFAQRSEPVLRMASGGMTGYMPGFKDTGAVNAAFEAALQKTLKYEGGYVEDDAGKGPSNFGINKTANPDVDVKGLTKDKARELYKKRYWDAIGGDALAAKDPALATIAFDTAVNMGVSKANQLVSKAKGDPSALLGMRQQHYDSLVKKDPEKFSPYEKGWKARVADLATSIIPSAEAGELPKKPAAEPAYKGGKAEGTGDKIGQNAAALAASSGLSALANKAPMYLDKFAPSLVNDPKGLAQAARSATTAGGVMAAIPAIGGVLSTGAANALSNATPEQLAQMEEIGRAHV